jgi:hypothetical protein
MANGLFFHNSRLAYRVVTNRVLLLLQGRPRPLSALNNINKCGTTQGDTHQSQLVAYITMFVPWYHIPMIYAPKTRPYSFMSTNIALVWLTPSVLPGSFTSTQMAWPFAIWPSNYFLGSHKPFFPRIKCAIVSCQFNGSDRLRKDNRGHNCPR